MANNIIRRKWNQNTMVSIEDLSGSAFQAESGGHTFEISGVDNYGNTVALSGTVAGVFMRSDNTDVAITGTASGGIVTVTLPAECYDVPGRFGLTIFVTADSKKTAIYAAIGTVRRTSSGNVAPGTTADVVDLINAINAAVATIPQSWSGLMADIAPTYSDSALYSVGQYAWYDGDLKRCIVPITTAESYNAAHWTSAVLGQDVSELKSNFVQYTIQEVSIESGTYLDNDGKTKYANANRARNVVPVILKDFISLKVSTGYSLSPLYLDADMQKISVSSTWLNTLKRETLPDNAVYLNFYIRNDSHTSSSIVDEISTIEAGTVIAYENLTEVSDFIDKETTSNLFTGSFENASFNSSTGAISKRTQTTECLAEAQYIPVESSTDYSLYVKVPTVPFNIRVYEYDSSKVFISPRQDIFFREVNKFKTSSSTKYVRFEIYKGSTSTADLFPAFFGLYEGLVIGEVADHETLSKNRLEYGNRVQTIIEKSRNLFNGDFSRATISSSGNYSEYADNVNSYAACPAFVPAEASTNYNAEFGVKGFRYNLYVHEYGSDGSQLRQTTFIIYTGLTGIEFTTGTGTKYLRFHIYSDGATYANLKPYNFRLFSTKAKHPYVNSNAVSPYCIDSDLLMDVNAEAVLPAYYHEGNYIDNKVDAIRTLMNGCAANGDAFIFITDEHWEYNAQNSPALIRYITQQLHIKRLFSGGDMGESGDYRFADRIRKAFANDRFYVMGNHDYRADTNVLYRVYDMDNNCQIGNVDRHYYYVDNVQQKIRYIVLSAYNTGETTGFGSVQLEWLTTEAMNVEAGWTIIVLVHTTYQISYTTNELQQDIPNDYLNAFDNYSGNGKIACIISGHAHRDRMTATSGGIPIVITTCDKYKPYTIPDTEYTDINVTRTPGTITEQAFDVVVLDKTNKKLTFVRIGAQALNGTGNNPGTAVEYREVTYT